MAECRDCGRALGGPDGHFESCRDHDLDCVVPEPSSIELADIAVIALHWAARRAATIVACGLTER